MATYEEQIEGLTGLSIDGTSNPTQSETTQFLKDGVKDVINKVKIVNPSLMSLFSTTSVIGSSGMYIEGEILDAWGTSGSNEYSADRLTPGQAREASDSTNLNYRSEYQPYYYREGKKVFIKPNGGSVLHIDYPSVQYNSSNMLNFPEQYEYLVVLYGSIQAMLHALSSVDSELPTDIEFPAVPVEPTLSSNTVASLGTSPSYTPPVLSTSISNIDTQITNDDPEMADIERNKVNAEIDEYNAKVTDAVNVFNKENAVYQAELQKKIQDGQLSSQDDAQKVQAYSSKIQSYTAELQNKLADYGAKVQKISTKYQWMQGRLALLKQQYNEGFGAMPQPQEPRQGEGE